MILRTFNDPALKAASGDIFGRIYEYFLTQFADLKAHDNGEFFTPVSLVQMIVNVIEPEHGKVLDPACGSGGMFVQSAHFIETLQQNPTERAIFYGQEKNATTIRLENEKGNRFFARLLLVIERGNALNVEEVQQMFSLLSFILVT